MRPELALLLCAGFVVALLHIEYRQSKQLSLSTWIPTLYMLLIASKPMAIWFGVPGENMEAGSPLDRLLLTSILSVAAGILLCRKFNWWAVLKRNPWLILLLIYMLASIFWSEMAFVSFKRWIKELTALVMAMLLVSERDPRAALESVFRRTIYILIPFSYLLIHYFPELGRAYGRWSGTLMWIGVATQKNSLARLCVFSIIYLTWTLLKRSAGREKAEVKFQKAAELLLLFLSVWIMGGPRHTPFYSATAFAILVLGIAMIAGLVWLHGHHMPVGEKTLMLTAAFIIIYGIMTPFMGKLLFFDISDLLGRDATLTGRSFIWETLTQFALRKPLLGYGYGGFWTDAIREMTSSHAHNGYLDIILNIGFVGIVMVAMFVLASLRHACRVMTRDLYWGALYVCFIFICILYSISESSISSFSNHLSVVLIFFVISSTPRRTGIFEEKE